MVQRKGGNLTSVPERPENMMVEDFPFNYPSGDLGIQKVVNGNTPISKTAFKRCYETLKGTVQQIFPGARLSGNIIYFIHFYQGIPIGIPINRHCGYNVLGRSQHVYILSKIAD